MTKDKAMKLALEALIVADKRIVAGGLASDARLQMKKAITALHQAIEQAEDVEPFAVAWAMDGELFWPSEYEVIAQEGDGAQPLYTAPPKREWVGLTDEDVDKLCMAFMGQFHKPSFARAIEAKLKEKNCG